MSAPSRWSRQTGQPFSPTSKTYSAPKLVDGTWCMEVKDGHTLVVEVRKFPSEDAAWASHTEHTQRQHWAKKRATRGRAR